MNKEKKPMGFWIAIIAVVAVVCVVALVILQAHRQTGALVRVTLDGQEVGTYALDQDRTLEFASQSGGHNTVVIQNGAVRVEKADCPDQVCVRKGPTDQTADPIACLPNSLILEVIPGSQAQPEGGTP